MSSWCLQMFTVMCWLTVVTFISVAQLAFDF